MTTGAGNDIKKATQIVRGIVNTYGMSDGLGLISYRQSEGSAVLPYSERTAELIDEEIQKITKQCYEECLALLESKKDDMERLAQLLLEKETVNLPQIIEVLGERPFEMKESIKEYLSEIKQREQEQREADAAEAATEAE